MPRRSPQERRAGVRGGLERPRPDGATLAAFFLFARPKVIGFTSNK
jgi:hypothetical protein